jgi:hypothetical protein
MSDRALYRSIPLLQRRCCFCEEPIQRNLLRTKDGRLWHYGCYNIARDQHFKCNECFSNFDGTEVTWEDSETSVGEEFRPGRKAVCPHCGIELKSPSQRSLIQA